MKKEKEKKKKRDRRLPEPAPAEAPVPEADPFLYLNRTVGGKWKLRILWALRDGSSKRYRQIKDEVSGITDMMLSQSLRELCADAFAERRQFQEIPPRVEYRLTPGGAELLPALSLLVQWAVKSCAQEEGSK